MNCKTILCSNVETTDTGVVLIPNRTVKNLINAETYGLVICNNVAATANLPVFIQTTIGNIPVLCKAGNTMYANQLDTRVRYPIIYGNGNVNYPDGQFVVLSCVSPRATIAAPESI
jgi:hypothetical protein